MLAIFLEFICGICSFATLPAGLDLEGNNCISQRWNAYCCHINRSCIFLLGADLRQSRSKKKKRSLASQRLNFSRLNPFLLKVHKTVPQNYGILRIYLLVFDVQANACPTFGIEYGFVQRRPEVIRHPPFCNLCTNGAVGFSSSCCGVSSKVLLAY